MIKMLVLKNPNIDIIAEVNEDRRQLEFVDLTNVFICAWIQDYVRFIPFKAAKDLNINMPKDNIAMQFETSDEMIKLYKKHVNEYFTNKDKYKLMDKEEFENKAKEKAAELNKRFQK